MLTRILNIPAALSCTRLSVVVGVAVFVSVLVLLSVLSQLGIDLRSLTGTLLAAAGAALVAGGGVYIFIRVPLERAQESRVAGLAASAAHSQKITSDALTGLLNRQGITASLLEAMAHAERYGNPLSVALISLDGLARVREASGRKAGDRLVRSAARLFGEALRLPDRVGRYDDNEFLAVLPQASLKNTGSIAERIRASATSMTVATDKVHPATLSVGLGCFRKGEDLENLLARVGRALHEARQAGGNRAVSSGTI